MIKTALKVKSIILRFFNSFTDKINSATQNIKKYIRDFCHRFPKLEKFLSSVAKIWNKNRLLSTIILTDFLLILIGLIAQVNLLFILTACVWFDIIIYSFFKLEKRAMLIAFATTFFIFLMGKEFLQQYLHYRADNEFSATVMNHTYFSMFLSLASVFVGYLITARKTKRETVDSQIVRGEKYNSIRKIALPLLIFSLVPAIVYQTITFIFVQKNGYFAYYTEFQKLIEDNIVLYIITKLEQVLPAAMCIYMATLPSKKSFLRVTVFYVIYLLIALCGGDRSAFVLGLFLILFYFIYRSGVTPEENWFKRKYLLWCVVVLGIVAMFLYFFGLSRDGSDSEGGILDGIFGFFYSQGISSNVIKRAYTHADYIPDYLYTMEFTRSGFIARILGIPVYHGTTLERALYGGSFSHALSYVILGDAYLTGRTTGTSYIAELYFDYGYIGILLGGLIYGFLFAKIDNFKNNRLFIRSCLFIMITQLLWAPRGSFCGMITTIISPVVVMVLLFVFGFDWLLRFIKNRSSKVKEE